MPATFLFGNDGLMNEKNRTKVPNKKFSIKLPNKMPNIFPSKMPFRIPSLFNMLKKLR